MRTSNPVCEKLDEAKYFLERMRQSTASPQGFKYNLSAFLSAARSVTFVLQAHYARMPDFHEWYAGLELDEDPLLKFFNMGRVTAVHKGPVPVGLEEQAEIVSITDGLVTVRATTDGPLPPEWMATAEPHLVIEKDESHGAVTSTAKVSDLSDVLHWSAKRGWDAEYEVRRMFRWVFEEPPEEVSQRDGVLELCADYIGRLEQIVEGAVERLGD